MKSRQLNAKGFTDSTTNYLMWHHFERVCTYSLSTDRGSYRILSREGCKTQSQLGMGGAALRTNKKLYISYWVSSKQGDMHTPPPDLPLID